MRDGHESEQPGFESPALQREIKTLRDVDNFTNLFYLAMEYFCLIMVIGSTVAFAQFPVRWGLAWSWNIPVVAMAIVLIGGIQHRLAGLGHEANLAQLTAILLMRSELAARLSSQGGAGFQGVSCSATTGGRATSTALVRRLL